MKVLNGGLKMKKLIKITIFSLFGSLVLNNLDGSLKRKLECRRRQAEETRIQINTNSQIDLTELKCELEKQIENERFSFLDLPYFTINKILLSLNMPSLIKVALSCEKLYDQIVNNDAFLSKYKWEKTSDKSFFILSTNISLKNWEFINQFLDQPKIKDEHLITHAEYPSVLVQMVENQAPIELIIKAIKNCGLINIWQNHLEFNENRNIIQTYTPLGTLLKNFHQYPEQYFYNTLYFLLETEGYENFKEDRTENTHIHLIIQDISLDAEIKINMLRAFYEFEVNFNQLNSYNENALHLALQNSLDIKIIDFLIFSGCKVYSNMFDLTQDEIILNLLKQNYSEDNDFDLIPEEESDSCADFASF
jgi:hypothetical protein